MQQWEYKFVQTMSHFVAVEVNGEKLEPQQSIWIYANELGKDGWELITTLTTRKSDTTMCVFKRPKTA